MLKPADPGSEPPNDERPIGELLQELVEEGKAYARAELDVVKAIAAAKGKAVVWPAGLLLAALIVLQSAVTILAVGLFFTLVSVMPAIAAGLISSVIFVAIAGVLAWYGYARLRRDL